MSERCGRCAMTTCRSQKGNAFLFLLSMTANKVPSGSSDPNAGMAACFAKTSSAYNGTPAQPQPQAMGAARRDPRRGESPMMCASAVQVAALPGEVVSNTGDNKTFNGLDIRSNGGRPSCSRKAEASTTKAGDPYFCGINSYSSLGGITS